MVQDCLHPQLGCTVDSQSSVSRYIQHLPTSLKFSIEPPQLPKDNENSHCKISKSANTDYYGVLSSSQGGDSSGTATAFHGLWGLGPWVEWNAYARLALAAKDFTEASPRACMVAVALLYGCNGP